MASKSPTCAPLPPSPASVPPCPQPSRVKLFWRHRVPASVVIVKVFYALCVSESTVRTYIRRIYEKTEAHSKQELVDLIDRS